MRGRWDAKSNPRDYGIARNFGSGLRDRKTLLGTLHFVSCQFFVFVVLKLCHCGSSFKTSLQTGREILLTLYLCNLRNLHLQHIFFAKVFSPGAPLTYFNDRGVGQTFIFYTLKKSQLQNLSTQKNPYFL